jgi:Zn finger protein HypA/HybF involved in hydrogenase expression
MPERRTTMTTWKCHDCESMFDDPDPVLYRGRRIGNGSENWEREEYIYVCPVCGSTEIYEAYFCDDCEKEVEEGELDEDDFCPECAAKADAYDEMVDRVKSALSTPIDMEQIIKQIITKPKGE